MTWPTLFDRTHILKGVPVDADIELQCKKCKAFFHTKNTYYIGYSDISYANPEEEGSCDHDITELKPTKKWFPSRDIHRKFSDGSWASLFDYSHIIEGAPVDANIELLCHKCNTRFYTMNAYYIGYSEIFYINPEDEGKCEHNLKELILTEKWHSK